MKKWLTACLLAIALLFAATTAMAGHNKANGEYCLGGSYVLLKEYENQHLRRCNDCQEELLENHWVGQEATCIQKAECGDCTKRFGEYGPHDWGEWKPNDNGTHTRTCKHKSDHVDTEDCTFSVAPCDDYSPCTKCGAYSKLGHDWGGWTPNGDKTHTHVCTRDPSHTETEDCGDFWEADCTTPAMCWYCRGTHGETDPSKHSWDRPYPNYDGAHTYTCRDNPSHTKKEACFVDAPFTPSHGDTAWCGGCWEEMIIHNFDGNWAHDADGHWKTCQECGKSQGTVPHSFVEQVDEEHLKSEATCVSVAVYYKSCSVCGHHATDTFESGDINPDNHDTVPVEAKDPTCTEDGWPAHDACQREGCGYTNPNYLITYGGHLLNLHNSKKPTCAEPGWKAYETCGRCDYTTYQELPIDPGNHDLEQHTAKAPTCTEKGWSAYDTCTRCDYTSYQEVDALDHDWNDWTSNGDKTHTRTCRSDPGHTETEACSGVRCGDTGACSVCGGEYTAEHKYDEGSWSCDDAVHWRNCVYCHEKGEIASHSFEMHEQTAATCVSKAVYIRVCSYCDYQGGTFIFGNINPDNHDLIPHAAQAPTCTEKGWEDYDTCSRCDYSTYAELPALDHGLIPHTGKAATCTESGWEAYDTCSRCNYTTYAELAALDHDWSNWVSNGYKTHARTCKNDPDHIQRSSCSGVSCGETGTCAVCGGEYTVAHDYIGSWTSDGADTHWRVCILCGAGRETASHSFSEYPDSKATCVSPAKYLKICLYCFYREIIERGDTDPNNHDLVHHEAQAPTCTEIGWEAYDTCSRCDYTTYAELPAGGHDLIPHAAQAPTCTEVGWEAYDACSRCDYSTYVELPAEGHDPIPHAGKAATCTKKGWKEYDTCSRCNYTTYAELPVEGHDLIPHAAQAPTCTEIGWEAYDTCSRCDYTTYAELPAEGHDLIRHTGKAATCTEKGWSAYDTCKREGCGYTTYREHDALGHAYEARTGKPTCTKKGHTLHTCARCKASYTDAVVSSRGHWYGEWSPNGDGTHSADCRRDGCKHTGRAESEKPEYRLRFADAEDYVFELCPVCGEVSDGTRLTLIEEARATAQRLPRGELVLRIGDLQNGERVLSVGFEYGGRLTQPTGQVEITLPAALLDGCALMLLDADGAETALSYTLNGGEATFVLDFTADESPALALRLVPVS